jgi:dienelactone hydrolase
MSKLSRRELGRLAAAMAVAPAVPANIEQPAAQSVYSGPLTGVGSGLEDRQFDPVAFAHGLYASTPRRLAFQATTRAEAEAWQKTLRTKLLELVGGFPGLRAPLRPKVLETRNYPVYRRDKVIFDSRPGSTVLAYVLVPTRATSPVPAVICLPGHGRGVDDIVGIDERGGDRTEKIGYAYDFAIQVAEAGLAAVAIEQIGFGCRRDPRNASRGLAQKGCDPAAGMALMLGETLIGWRVWDVVRTLEYISTRLDLDASRLGCIGISGGGTAALFAAALEPRIKAAMISGYLNTFKDSIGSLNHCMDNFVPGILRWAEMHDVAGLIAPRPFFAESGENDNIFPVGSAKESFAHVRRIYDVFGAADRIEHDVFPADHSFWGKRGIPFLVKSL